MREIIFIIASIVLLTLLLINNFYDSKKNKFKITIFVALLSLILHFHMYSNLSDGTVPALFTSLLKTVSATLKLFAGYTLLSDTDFIKVFNENAFYMILVYYILHILAFTITISTIILAVSKKITNKLLTFIRLCFHKKNILIFYKYNALTETLILKLNDYKDKFTIILLDDEKYDHIDNSFNDLVLNKSCVVLKESIKENNKFKDILFNGKYNSANIKIFAISESIDVNYQFADVIFNLIKNKDHNKVSLTVISNNQYDFSNMQENKGFDFVRSFNKKDIISRLLVKEYPPCNYLDFENCKIKDSQEFNSLIIGFGELGQKIFKRLFVYGQLGEKFNCKIVDEKYESVCAEFLSEFDFLFNKVEFAKYSYLTDKINVETENYSAKSKNFYNYIKEYATKLNYVIVSTSSEKINSEVVSNLLYLRDKLNGEYDIFDCLDERIYVYKKNEERKKVDIYNYILDDSIDNLGKLINYAYTKDNPEDIYNININEEKYKIEIESAWHSEKCKSYDKNSSISSAEFFTTINRIINGKIDKLSDEDLNNLGILEHNRWSAFMLSEGYRHMEYDIINKKNKYLDIKKHACLIPWSKLNELDEIEYKTTGINPEYQKSDKKNVIMAVRIAKKLQ